MNPLRTFVQRLRSTEIRSHIASEETLQRAHVRGSNVISLREKTVRQKPQPNETCRPTEADYEAASRLRDPEYGYEFEMWRLW